MQILLTTEEKLEAFSTIQELNKNNITFKTKLKELRELSEYQLITQGEYNNTKQVLFCH